MESASPRAPDPELSEITLTREGDLWVARDEETGVASQGETREDALAMLDEAVALHRGEIGEPVTDEDIEELGIDPAAPKLTQAHGSTDGSVAVVPQLRPPDACDNRTGGVCHPRSTGRCDRRPTW